MYKSPSSKLAARVRSSFWDEVRAFSRSRAAVLAFCFWARALGESTAVGVVYTTAHTSRPDRTCFSVLLIRALLLFRLVQRPADGPPCLEGQLGRTSQGIPENFGGDPRPAQPGQLGQAAKAVL